MLRYSFPLLAVLILATVALGTEAKKHPRRQHGGSRRHHSGRRGHCRSGTGTWHATSTSGPTSASASETAYDNIAFGVGGHSYGAAASSADGDTVVTVVKTSTTTASVETATVSAMSTSAVAGVAVSPSIVSTSSAEAAAVATSATETVAATGSTSTAGVTSVNGTDFTSSVQSTLLDLHNAERAHYGADPLTWDNAMSAYAVSHAAACVWGHSGGPYGENIAADSPDVTVLFDLWAGESANYTTPGFSESTGHFTQIVWKATTKVGCGWFQCNADTKIGNAYYLVCEYDPAGNVADDTKGADVNTFYEENVGSYTS